ncbi:MAG: Crp/Fnr family transcriptional regulator [Synergistaceae bacterium]|nr:Crp/Fnr family transcriptional regulator [Synergistaceae bacterium]MBQ3586528.1 Crp/Fnr family transcriptional regulator [Synergistaceae bacterium]
MRDSEIFAGFSDNEYSEAMTHISAGEYSYRKGQMIFTAGDITDKAGLVISGSVAIESTDIFGNASLLTLVGKGGYFALSYALLGVPMISDVRANENCIILFLKVRGIEDSETWTQKLTQNLLAITARKNLHLSERSYINANKTIRRKVMSYLKAVSLRENSRDFVIPFSRSQMADYLSTDRSALSRELCLMRDEGLISFRRNHFSLHV